MITIPPLKSFSKIRTELIPDITKTWKTGQLLNATVESDVTANGRLLMRMGQYVLETKTPISLQAGDHLKLLVKSSGDPPVLKILTTADLHQTAAQNLKSFIARQQDLTQLLKLNGNIFENPAIPKTLKQQLVQLNQILPGVEQAIQAQALKTMIQNSGIFLEAKLYNQKHSQQQTLNQDIKSQLLKIGAQLQSLVPELTAKPPVSTLDNIQTITAALVKQFVEGKINLVQFSVLLTNRLSDNQIGLILQALNSADKTLLPKELLAGFTVLLNYIQQQARPQQLLDNLSTLLKTLGLLQELKIDIDGVLAKITSQQLTTLTRDEDGPLVLLFDLILKDKSENHLIQFRLEQENPADEGNDTNWVIDINFSFTELGPVQARVHLTDNNISTMFRAENESTVKTISKQISLLDTAFRSIGFDVVSLDVTHGSITRPRDLPKNVHILDEIA